MPPTTLIPSFCEVYDYPLIVQAAVVAGLLATIWGIVRVRMGRVPDRPRPSGPRPPREGSIGGDLTSTGDFGGIFGTSALVGPPASPARLEPEARVERWRDPTDP